MFLSQLKFAIKKPNHLPLNKWHRWHSLKTLAYIVRISGIDTERVHLLNHSWFSDSNRACFFFLFLTQRGFNLINPLIKKKKQQLWICNCRTHQQYHTKTQYNCMYIWSSSKSFFPPYNIPKNITFYIHHTHQRSWLLKYECVLHATDVFVTSVD